MPKTIKRVGGLFPWYAGYFLVLAVFILLSVLGINRVLPNDDLTELIPAKILYLKGFPQMFPGETGRPFYYHPPLYLEIVAGLYKVFGFQEWLGRLLGIICGLVSIFLVFLIARSFSYGQPKERLRLAILVSALYALAPGTIQGVAVMQMDNTILVPAVLFLFFISIKYFQEKQLRWLYSVVPAVALALWMRISTPAIVIFMLVAYSFIGNNLPKTKALFNSAVICGVLLFLFSWYFYCRVRGTHFSGPFLYTFYTVRTAWQRLIFLRIFLNIFYFSIWPFGFSPIVVRGEKIILPARWHYEALIHHDFF